MSFRNGISPADGVAAGENVCSRLRSKVPRDMSPSYIKTVQPSQDSVQSCRIKYLIFYSSPHMTEVFKHKPETTILYTIFSSIFIFLIIIEEFRLEIRVTDPSRVDHY